MVQAKPWSATLVRSARRFSLSRGPPSPCQAASHHGAVSDDGLRLGMASGVRRGPSTSCTTSNSLGLGLAERGKDGPDDGLGIVESERPMRR